MRLFLSCLLCLLPLVPAAQAQTAGDPAPAVGVHGLSLPASLTGTLPCPDCDGIETRLTLWPDQTYHLARTYLGRDSDARADEIGRWYADPAADALVLMGGGAALTRWKVGAPDALRLLAEDGSAVEPPLTAAPALDTGDLGGLALVGMMTYFADAAIFVECHSGRSYPVAMEGGNLDLERAYLANRPAPGAPLWVEVTGGLALRPAMEGPDRQSLVVDSFQRARPGLACVRATVPPSLTGGYWRIDTLNGAALAGLPDRPAPSLAILEGETLRLGATLGCNRMMASVTLEGETISFGPVAGTMMACPPPLDGLERDLAAALAEVQSLRQDGVRLELLDASGATRLGLTAADRP